MEIRTIDAVTGVTSPVFQGDTSRPASVLQAGINGFVWNDLDGDADLENGEARLAGWTVRLVDSNGSPLNLVQVLEPDGYATGMVLNSVHPQARLSLSGDLAGTVCGGLLWQSEGIWKPLHGLGTSSTWKPGELGMRVDFTTPVTTVRLDAIGTATGDRARLEAYDRFGMLIGRYTTSPLADGQLETMQIQRPTRGHCVRDCRCAQRHRGAVGSAAIRSGIGRQDGRPGRVCHSRPARPATTLSKRFPRPAACWQTSRREVTLAEGEALGSVDLVAHTGGSSWQNPVRPTDVNGDGDVTALDALVLINYINAHNGDVSLPAHELPPPYLDVDGNGLVTAADVLVVINQLNNAATSSSSAGNCQGESPGPSFAEGESPDVGGLTRLSPSLASPLTVLPARAVGDAHHETTMAALDRPPVAGGSGPSRLHHVVPTAELASSVRRRLHPATSSRLASSQCHTTRPVSSPTTRCPATRTWRIC